MNWIREKMKTKKVNCLGNNAYKYSILARIRKMPYDDYQAVLTVLPDKFLNVSRGTFYNWLYIKKSDSRQIDAESLRVIAQFLECTVDDLLN